MPMMSLLSGPHILRAGVNAGAEVIGEMQAGELFEVIEKRAGNLRVLWHGKEGWLTITQQLHFRAPVLDPSQPSPLFLYPLGAEVALTPHERRTLVWALTALAAAMRDSGMRD